MALTITWNGRGVIANCDALADTAGGTWAEDGAGGIGLNEDTYLTGSASIGSVYAAKVGISYYTTPATYNFTPGTGAEAGQFIYMWINISSPSAFELMADHGFSIVVGTDTDNYKIFQIAGSGVGESNGWAGGWKLFVIDPTLVGSLPDVGTFNIATINMIGLYISTIVSVRADTIFIDQMAIASGLRVTGTGTLDEVVDYCSGQLASRAWGIFQQREGIYFSYGNLAVGDSASATENTVLDMEGSVVQYGVSEFWNGNAWVLSMPHDYNGVVVEKHASYTTELAAENTSLFGSVSAPLSIETDSGTALDISGGSFKNLAQTTLKSGDVIEGAVLTDCGDLTPNGATISNTSISESLINVASLALVNSSDLDTLSNLKFSKYFNWKPWDLFKLNTPPSGTETLTYATTRYGFCFNPDGTQIFSFGYDNSRIYQTTLDIPWDITSSSAEIYETCSSGLHYGGIWIDASGTRVYTLYWTGILHMYTLTTPWDITTISVTYDAGGLATDNDALVIDSTGTKLMVSNSGIGGVSSYTLSTPWDITTLSAATNKVLPEGIRYGVAMSPDGLTLFTQTTTGAINKYGLTTPWDASTIGSILSTNITPYNGALFVDTEGKRVYAGSWLKMEAYYLFNEDTSNAIHVPASVTGTISFNNFTGDGSGTDVYWGTPPSPWDLSKADYASNSVSIATHDFGIFELAFSLDGLKMFELCFDLSVVYQSNLTTPWDITTASYVATVDCQDTISQGLAFSTDGLKMYEIGTPTDLIYQYDLSTPWDITTADYATNSVNIATQGDTPTALTFSFDGTKMYEGATDTNLIYQYDLSTPWDLSTADYITNSVNISTQASTLASIEFSTDGTKMYEVDSGTDLIYQYDVGTPWDLSTADYATNSVNISTQADNPRGLAFKPDGLKMYEVDPNAAKIYQYDFYTPENVSSTLTINKSNGTDLSTWASSGGTVELVSSVSIALNVKDQQGQNINLAYVYVDEDLEVPGSIVNTQTDINGDVNTSYSGAASTATVRVRKYGYRPYVGVISLTADSSTNIVLITDPQQV